MHQNLGDRRRCFSLNQKADIAARSFLNQRGCQNQMETIQKISDCQVFTFDWGHYTNPKTTTILPRIRNQNNILESFCFTFSCSISQISDYSVQVWDVRRPYVSFVSFNEHTDIPTSFLWMSNPHTLLSAGKDNLVCSNVIEFTILASLAKLTDI